MFQLSCQLPCFPQKCFYPRSCILQSLHWVGPRQKSCCRLLCSGYQLGLQNVSIDNSLYLSWKFSSLVMSFSLWLVLLTHWQARRKSLSKLCSWGIAWDRVDSWRYRADLKKLSLKSCLLNLISHCRQVNTVTSSRAAGLPVASLHPLGYPILWPNLTSAYYQFLNSQQCPVFCCSVCPDPRTSSTSATVLSDFWEICWKLSL